MSLAQHSAYLRGGAKLGPMQFCDTLMTDGLTDAFCQLKMGQTAEFLAREYKVDRKAQDDFAYESQRRASEAIANGWFKEEVVPVLLPRKKGETTTDEFVKTGLSREALDALKPCFETDPKLVSMLHTCQKLQ